MFSPATDHNITNKYQCQLPNTLFKTPKLNFVDLSLVLLGNLSMANCLSSLLKNNELQRSGTSGKQTNP
ncbi:unnamed protein product [Ambrosiozyma monospora]|uniref:Unnamed protein product n=1 Tax=Ambrosiozyma monospora TaxID=43982 RepID=A0ACB5UD82_AMBMO|nr:unnamed protein product [Ambrosiozyma monospora]